MRFKEEEILKVERQIQSLKQQLKFLEGRLEKQTDPHVRQLVGKTSG